MERYLSPGKNDTIEELQLVTRILTRIAHYYFTESIENGMGNGARVELDEMFFNVWLDEDQIKIGLTEENDGEEKNSDSLSRLL